MPTSTEVVTFSNISATTAAFALRGGKYAFTVNGTGFGTVRLETLGGDGTTWVTVSSQAANASVSVDLYPGQFRIGITTTTAVFVIVGRVPS